MREPFTEIPLDETSTISPSRAIIGLEQRRTTALVGFVGDVARFRQAVTSPAISA
jgi:hypothetical protein